MLFIKTLRTITAIGLLTLVVEIYNPTLVLAKQVNNTNSVSVLQNKQPRKTFNVFKLFRYPKQSRISR